MACSGQARASEEGEKLVCKKCGACNQKQGEELSYLHAPSQDIYKQEENHNVQNQCKDIRALKSQKIPEQVSHCAKYVPSVEKEGYR